MFVTLGVLTIMVGILTIILMPDNPMSAKWLSDTEKTAAIQRVAENQTGIQNRHFKWHHLRELALDVQIWLLVILITLVRMLSLEISFLHYILSSLFCAILDLGLLWDNHNLLRNRHPQFRIFLSGLCAPQHAERVGQHCIRRDHWLFCRQTV
jgi:hypothetical protein